MFNGMNSPRASFGKIVIGIGNDYRGDDAVGLLAARGIAKLAPKGVEVIESSGDSASLIELWKGSDLAVAIDAISSGEKPGKIYRFEPIWESIPSILFSKNSTHDFGLHEAIELSRTLGAFPKRLIVYGIVGESFDQGADITEVVDLAVEKIVPKVLEDLSSMA